METKTYSVNEIIQILDNIRRIVSEKAKDGLIIKLKVYIDESDNSTIYKDFNTKKADKENRMALVEEFNEALRQILQNKQYTAFYCLIKSSNGVTTHFENKIPLQSGTINNWCPSNTSKSNEDFEEQSRQTLQQQNSTGKAVKDILGLMGFDRNKLNGFGDDEFGGFGAIMQVRENLLENRFIQADKDRRYDEMVTEKAKLESQLEALQKELDNANKYSEELEDKIDDLECKIEDLEHLKPEYSLGGMSLVGILEKTATNLAIKHADVLGGLAGMSKDEMVTLLQKPQTEATTPQQISNEEVEVSQVSPRSEHINAIGKFVDTLSDDEFNDFWSVMQAFAKDKTLINKTLTNITNE
jgi:hypothetical protein